VAVAHDDVVIRQPDTRKELHDSHETQRLQDVGGFSVRNDVSGEKEQEKERYLLREVLDTLRDGFLRLLRVLVNSHADGVVSFTSSFPCSASCLALHRPFDTSDPSEKCLGY